MLLNRLRSEQGFTTVILMVVLLVGGLLVTASFAASDGDTSIARHDQYYKQAYSAAEAGINYYYYQLNADVNYWTKCPAATTSIPVNKVSTSSSSQVWRSLPGNTDAKYSIEVLPATGATLPACTGTAPNQTITGVINNTTGTFKVRSTGSYRGVKRSIVATFKRKGFLDFLWFTNYETNDPATYPPSQQSSASTKCVMYYRDGRPNQIVDTSTSPDTKCQDPDFITGDSYAGPMHTNDEFSVCGNPVFGRFAADSIEMSADSPGYHSTCSGSNPNFKGTKTTKAPILTMPPSNTSLKTVAQSGGLLLTGTSKIVLSGGSLTVNGSSATWPANGVIYVQNGTCTTTGYDSTEKYVHDAGCGDAWVHSTSDVTSDLTIASDNDIIVDGNLTHDDNTEIGLIANNFVRLYHPVNFGSGDSCNGNATGAMTNPVVEAAILSVTHSWIVDNWWCGAPLGSLTVDGAIAQKFRGPVGTHQSGTVKSGYLKNYSYDDDLRFRDPPFFLDPIQASWRILGENEQVAAH